ncbi:MULTISPECIES: hypothetical protein [Bacillales]|uniref:hypothetical protein n=1 Tax=Bacillales TaxID=1385 RepID=UPI0023789436|nr:MULTISPECIES: hypothetical protein [Bacillales]MDR6878626.1 hypothetical protein [Bacillus sp. 3255]
MVFQKRTKLGLVTPLPGRLTIIQIRQKPIHTKQAMIQIMELEKSQFTFESSLILPTDREVLYGFEFSMIGRVFRSEGCIRQVNQVNDSCIYTAHLQPVNYAEFEMLYAINRLASIQNKEFGKLAKSYDYEHLQDDMLVDYSC